MQKNYGEYETYGCDTVHQHMGVARCSKWVRLHVGSPDETVSHSESSLSSFSCTVPRRVLESGSFSMYSVQTMNSWGGLPVVQWSHWGVCTVHPHSLI